MNSGDFLSGSLSNDRRKNGRSESAGLIRRVESTKVEELAEEDKLRLSIRL